MKLNRSLILLSTALFLVGCGTTSASSNGNSVSSNNPSNSVSNSNNFKPLGPEIPNIPDDQNHDDGGWTFDMFRDMIIDNYTNKTNVNTFSYSKDVYLRSSSLTNKHEVLTTNYKFYRDDEKHTVMTGKAHINAGTGVLKPTLIDGAGYDYDIQCYADGGYLHYIEVVPEVNGKKSRVSYDSISKNNRYNNMYSIYSANPDLILMQTALDYIDGYYDLDCDYTARYIDTSTDEVILKITVEDYVAYTDYNYHYFLYCHASKESRKLTQIDYGWILYDPDGKISNERNIQTIRSESVYDFDYTPREKFNGTFYTEKDVDKVYGGPAQRKIDYSSWDDGVLEDDKSKDILSNLQAFGAETKSSKTTFSVDQFSDPADSVTSDGEFNIIGSIRGTFETKRYSGDFTEIKGDLALSDLNSGSTTNFKSNFQAKASDEGMYLIESYDNEKMYSHVHNWSPSEIDDPDVYINPNLIMRDEMYHPFSIPAKYGTNNPGVGDDDDEIPTNLYKTAGTLVKNGNVIAGTFSNIYHKNVWTPYWTYTASFKIEDGFLSEFSFSVSSYYETDTMQYTIFSNFSVVNTKGTDCGEFKGTVLDPNEFEEGEMFAKNERLYR